MLDILEESPRHFSITEIHKRVKKILPETGLATVYRALEVLMDLGLMVRVFGFDPSKDYVKIRERIGALLQNVEEQIIAPTV